MIVKKKKKMKLERMEKGWHDNVDIIRGMVDV